MDSGTDSNQLVPLHVGWITRDLEKFESFWVQVMGFQRVAESFAPREQCQVLFGINSPALIARYKRPDNPLEVEIHLLTEDPSTDSDQNFGRFGINHICFETGGPGSRERFLAGCPENVKIHRYQNPKGWENIFIQDPEGNWVELREAFHGPK